MVVAADTEAATVAAEEADMAEAKGAAMEETGVRLLFK